MKIFLIGFMASGKSSIARRLATYLNYRFLDTDQIIENLLELSISEIFDNFGENYFRFIESKVLFSLADFDNIVVATGGGLPCKQKNQIFLKTQGFSIFLNPPIDAIYHRLKNDINRPLLKNIPKNQLFQFIKTLYQKRQNCYNFADLSISSTNIEQTIDTIIQKLKNIETQIKPFRKIFLTTK